VKNPSTRRDPSTIVNRTVTPRRPPNADLREREYLTPKEVDRLQDAARKHSRYGHRDATAIPTAYRHGLRASELCELTWNMIELDSGRIHVRRAKNGVDSTHPLTGKEIRALRQLRRENLQSRCVFNTERGGPVTRAWFLKMVRRTGELARLSRLIRTCCAMPAASSLPTTASIPARCSTSSATAISCTRCAIPSCAPIASMGSGRTEGAHIGRNRRHGGAPRCRGCRKRACASSGLVTQSASSRNFDVSRK
jgi:Phage integrase family